MQTNYIKPETLKLEPKIKIYRTEFEVDEALAIDLYGCLNKITTEGRPASIAISGGNTPNLFFSVIAENFSETIDWGNVDIFWVDERCVPPYDKNSNYGNSKHNLLDKIDIPESNIHRIRGEVEPNKEVEWYSGAIRNYVSRVNGLPAFDFIMLGIGEDGHTASIFPNQMELISSDKICAVSINPKTGEKRITLTGNVINNASTVNFLVTGLKKAKIVADIITRKEINLPAAQIRPRTGDMKWFLDKEAASLLGDLSSEKLKKYKIIDKRDVII